MFYRLRGYNPGAARLLARTFAYRFADRALR